MLLYMLSVESAFSLFDTVTNHISPSPVVVSTVTTQELTPASTEISTTDVMNVGSISETELVTTQMETTASTGVATTLATKGITTTALQVATTANEDVGGTTTLATVTATSDAATFTNSSKFFMWREFYLLFFF